MRRTSRSGIGTTSGFGLSAHSRDEMDSIHYSTLQILQDTGIKVMSDKALEVFHGGGASVERIGEYGIVKLPSYLIEDCIHWAPHSIVYDARNPNDDYVAEPNRVGFTTFGGCLNVIDPITRQLRRATKKDCGEIARVCDYLDEICVATRAVNSTDVPGATQSVHNLEAILSNTGKHIFLGFYSAGNTRKMVEMAAACVGGKEKFKMRPTMTAFVCPTSPLQLVQMCCDVIIECARSGVPVILMVASIAGSTATFEPVASHYHNDVRNINEVQVSLGRWLDEHTRPNAWIGTTDAGAIRYFARRPAIDLLGLNTPGFHWDADTYRPLHPVDAVAAMPAWVRPDVATGIQIYAIRETGDYSVTSDLKMAEQIVLGIPGIPGEAGREPAVPVAFSGWRPFVVDMVPGMIRTP